MQIFPAVEIVDDAAGFIQGHRIDAEIAPGQIVPEGDRERNRLRPVAVDAIGFGPEGRDIIRRAFHDDDHHAEEHASFDGPPALLPCCLDNRGSMGGGRNINVLRNHSQQIIAHRAADNIRFVPRLPQGVQDSPRFLDDPRPPSSFSFTGIVRRVRDIPLQKLLLFPPARQE